MNRSHRQPRRLTSIRRSMALECLEPRQVLSSIPFGAAPEDTAEFMLGDVLVTVVLFESNGQIDEDREDWTPQEVERIKQNVREGLAWWEDLLAAQQTVHTLDFQIDFTYADQPIQTGYEPIGRPSDDFELWMEDFFAEVGLSGTDSASDRIRQFNHAQRVTHDTNWAFTIVVVNADQDTDGRFDPRGSFSQSFAFAGGRFFVTTSERPASSIAHETAHMFWAMDEYAGSKTYFNHRGYYDTQNTNAYDAHPNPELRVKSIMDSAVVGYALDKISPSAMETIGWRDSDGNGIYDILDVPHALDGSGVFDPLTRQYTFSGYAQVQTLKNLNGSSLGNDITLNRIDRIEFRFDASDWQTVETIGDYAAELEFSLAIPSAVRQLELRAIDDRTGVTSETWADVLWRSSAGWHNGANPSDVNADGLTTPLDALLVINQLNGAGSRALGVAPPNTPLIDVNSDGYLSPIDALVVINQLNMISRAVANPQAVVAPIGEGEPDSSQWQPVDPPYARPRRTPLATRNDSHQGPVQIADVKLGGFPHHRRGVELLLPAAALQGEFSRSDELQWGKQRTTAYAGDLVDTVILDMVEIVASDCLLVGDDT